MKKTLLLTLTLVCFVQLSLVAQKNVAVKGVINNNRFDNFNVVEILSSSSTNTLLENVPIDKTTTGSFSFSIQVQQPTIVKMNFDDKNTLLAVINPSEKIFLKLDATNMLKVDSVNGSYSINLIKKVTDLLVQENELVNEINNSFKTDKVINGNSSFFNIFNPFNQINVEIDENILASFENSKIIFNNTSKYINDKGNVVKKQIDSVLLTSKSAFKIIVRAKDSFTNYINNIYPEYSVLPKEELNHLELISLVDHYQSAINEKNKFIEEFLIPYYDEFDAISHLYDSLIYNGLSDKKLKELIANKIGDVYTKYLIKLKKNETEFKEKGMLANNIANDIRVKSKKIIDERAETYQKRYNNENNIIREKIKAEIVNNKNELTVLFFIDIFPVDKNLDLHLSVIDNLIKLFPNNEIVKEKYNSLHLPTNSTAIGSVAPELAFPDPEGNILKLSSLRGKYVLIDFWASWCGPCRKENPNVVALYEQYKNKGFEIYSVSLDRNKSNWVAAIEGDNLSWKNHVSDLKFWSSEGAAIYGVKAIPATFLIDPDGKIIAKNLRGEELKNTLSSLLNKK